MTQNATPSLSPFSVVETGVRLAVRLTPKAARNAVEKVVFDVQGRAELRVSVTTVPENGKANDALIKMLSKEWKIAKSRVSVISGHTDRHKTLLLETAEPEAEYTRLSSMIKDLPQ